MKQCLMLVFSFALSFNVGAAEIVWDFLQTNGSEVSAIYNNVDVMFDIVIKDFGSQTYLWASENNLRHGSLAPVQYWNSGAWVEASVGDLVDASTIFGRHTYWFYEMANAQPEYGSGMPRAIDFNESYYLMFAIEDMDDAWAYRLKETTEPPALYYGWAEYVVDENHLFRIVRSAVDFDGGPMIVGGGAIPEPSSALLLLLGISLISIRRQTGHG